MTEDQLRSDIAFLARRAQRAGAWSNTEDRDWGVSSNSLVSLAYGIGDLEMPSDWYDYAACERAANNMPPHRRTPEIMAALAAQRAHVAARHAEGEGHYDKAMRVGTPRG